MSVTANQGFTILDTWSLYHSNELKNLPLAETHPINLFWYKENPNATLPAFIKHCEDFFRSKRNNDMHLHTVIL
jgi:hypothetical protein